MRSHPSGSPKNGNGINLNRQRHVLSVEWEDSSNVLL